MATTARTGLVPEWFTPIDNRDPEHSPDELAEFKASEEEPPALEPVENPTRYLIRPLDGVQFMEVMTHGVHTPAGDFIPSHAGRLLVLKYCLKGWENLSDPDGSATEFSLPGMHKAPGHHLIECANHAIQISMPDAGDQKNSQ